MAGRPLTQISYGGLCMSLNKRGEPCQSKMVYRTKKGTLRCKWHGGRCTGPKTLEGIRRVSENLAAWRASCARASDLVLLQAVALTPRQDLDIENSDHNP